MLAELIYHVVMSVMSCLIGVDCNQHHSKLCIVAGSIVAGELSSGDCMNLPSACENVVWMFPKLHIQHNYASAILSPINDNHTLRYIINDFVFFVHKLH